MLRKIAVVTGTRADYGLLYWLLREIQDDADLELQLMVTGMHLAPEFGLTVREIENDGFRIARRVEMLLSSDTGVGMAKAVGVGTIGFADALSELAPDLVVVLGDRFEILAAVQAAVMLRIPVAHIHGGERTEGTVDEVIRHAVTKLSHHHFVSTEESRRRVIQLGEAPDRVFLCGAPGLDFVRRLEPLSRERLEADLGISLKRPCFLVAYHPALLERRPPEEGLAEVLAALDQFPTASLVITKANADAHGRAINRRLEEWTLGREDRVVLVASLGQQRFLSVMQQADVVIGNSSSGIIEAPAIPVATVNVGDRQKGRPRAASVVDADEAREAIAAAIRKALSPEFRRAVAKARSPFGAGDASRRIKAYIRDVELGDCRKSFYDLTTEASGVE